MKNTKQWVRAVCLILAALMLLSTLGALVYKLAYLLNNRFPVRPALP